MEKIKIPKIPNRTDYLNNSDYEKEIDNWRKEMNNKDEYCALCGLSKIQHDGKFAHEYKKYVQKEYSFEDSQGDILRKTIEKEKHDEIQRLINKEDYSNEGNEMSKEEIESRKFQSSIDSDDFSECFYCAKYTPKYRKKEKEFICNDCYNDGEIDSDEEMIDSELDLDEIDQELYEDTKNELAKQLFENSIRQEELAFLLNEGIHEMLDLDGKNVNIINCMTRLRERLSLQITEMPYKEFSQYISIGKLKMIDVFKSYLDENKGD